MKAIKLTEEHKSKLLEICRELFPEYSKIQFQDIYNNETGNLYFDNVTIGITIHWFEFCITHLAEKLVVDYGASYYEMTHNYHPIDYLYEEFKKLK